MITGSVYTVSSSMPCSGSRVVVLSSSLPECSRRGWNRGCQNHGIVPSAKSSGSLLPPPRWKRGVHLLLEVDKPSFGVVLHCRQYVSRTTGPATQVERLPHEASQAACGTITDQPPEPKLGGLGVTSLPTLGSPVLSRRPGRGLLPKSGMASSTYFCGPFQEDFVVHLSSCQLISQCPQGLYPPAEI